MYTAIHKYTLYACMFSVFVFENVCRFINSQFCATLLVTRLIMQHIAHSTQLYMHSCTHAYAHTYIQLCTCPVLSCHTAQHRSYGLPKREGTTTARVGHHITRATWIYWQWSWCSYMEIKGLVQLNPVTAPQHSSTPTRTISALNADDYSYL